MRDGCRNCKVEAGAGKAAMNGKFGNNKIEQSKPCVGDSNENKEHDSVDAGGCSISSSANSLSIMQMSQIPEEINSSVEVLPMELIDLLENPDNWSRKSSCNKKKMTTNNEDLAHHLYAKIHQVPRLYRNLYYYFVVRCDSLKMLNRYTSKLHAWELQFHNEEPLEVLKCWRLHLGSCEILKAVIQSREEPGFTDKLYARILPLRNAIRNWRFTRQGEVVGGGMITKDDTRQKENDLLKKIYTFLKIAWHSIKPFLGASTLYFEVFKDTSLAILIYSALNTMTKGDLLDKEVQFETTVLVALVSAIVTVQFCWMFISSYYAVDIFSMCKHWDIRLKYVFKILSGLFGPIMPAFVLANHVYYNEQSYSLQRDLQTLGKQKYDLCEAMSHVADDQTLDDNIDPVEHTKDESGNVNNHNNEETQSPKYQNDLTTNSALTENKNKNNEIAHSCHLPSEINGKNSDYKIWLKREKIRLFKKIVKVNFQAKYFRRIYSFYRVSAAVIESYCVITALVLILIVPGRQSPNLIDVLEIRLSDFMGIPRSHVGEGETTIKESLFLETFDMVRNVVFWGSISYSATMLLTALARYVYQCKSENISKIGQCCLGLYFLCHLVAKLTLTISIFATSEDRSDDENKKPTISKLPASIIISSLCILHLGVIYLYNHNFIREFRNSKNDLVERVIHVLANTLVVIPFMTWDVEGPSSIEKQWDGSIQHYVKNARTGSLDEIVKAMSAVKMSNKWSNRSMKSTYKRGHHKTLSAGNNFVRYELQFPDFTSPLIMEVGNIREKIESLWWENPSRMLTLKNVKDEFSKKSLIKPQDNVLEKAFDYLVEEGFINKRLYNPRRTKQEYFWLLSIHFLINLVGLGIEAINGGIDTPKGMYITWDIRMGSFSVGLLFLFLYYKRYHILKDLTRVHLCGKNCKYCQVFCCVKHDEPMQAIPDDEEMQNYLQVPNAMEITTKTIETQTSVQIENDPQELGDRQLTANDVPSDPRRMNGIKTSLLNQLRKFKRQTSSRSDTGEDRKNITVQTDSWPKKDDDDDPEVKETNDINMDVQTDVPPKD